MKTQRFIIVIAVMLVNISCESNIGNLDRNCDYLQNRLGEIVLNFEKKQGYIPETFEEALMNSNEILNNRGDVFGNSLVYQKTGKNSFYFLSYGKNGQFENGQGDDLKIEYQDKWLTSCEIDNES